MAHPIPRWMRVTDRGAARPLHCTALHTDRRTGIRRKCLAFPFPSPSSRFRSRPAPPFHARPPSRARVDRCTVPVAPLPSAVDLVRLRSARHCLSASVEPGSGAPGWPAQRSRLRSGRARLGSRQWALSASRLSCCPSTACLPARLLAGPGPSAGTVFLTGSHPLPGLPRCCWPLLLLSTWGWLPGLATPVHRIPCRLSPHLHCPCCRRGCCFASSHPSSPHPFSSLKRLSELASLLGRRAAPAAPLATAPDVGASPVPPPPRSSVSPAEPARPLQQVPQAKLPPSASASSTL